jgi:hypothetical protein
MPVSKEDEHFLGLAMQYYVAARSAALAQLMPVCGNLFHHAVEMLLKARLSHSRSLHELSRPPLGHKLAALWDAFKAEFPTVGLGQFDGTIANLDRFERVRYPDTTINEGAGLLLAWAPGPLSISYGTGVAPVPQYEIVITDIDSLVAKVFDICSRNPIFFTDGMNDQARDVITRDNRVATQLVRPRGT